MRHRVPGCANKLSSLFATRASQRINANPFNGRLSSFSKFLHSVLCTRLNTFKSFIMFNLSATVLIIRKRSIVNLRRARTSVLSVICKPAGISLERHIQSSPNFCLLPMAVARSLLAALQHVMHFWCYGLLFFQGSTPLK